MDIQMQEALRILNIKEHPDILKMLNTAKKQYEKLEGKMPAYIGRNIRCPFTHLEGQKSME